MNKQKKPGYWTSLAFTIMMAIGALLTVLPVSTAYKGNLLDYRSFCVFVPVSTAACVLIAGINCVVRRRMFTR